MTQTVSAIFDTYADASAAVLRLRDAGFQDSAIAVTSNDREVDRSSMTPYQYNENPDAAGPAATGAGIGAVAGGAAGLLAGLGLIAIPGLGPVVAAGWLASTALAAGAGGAAGALVGGLTGAGMSEDDAHVYAEGVRRGGTLVSVRAADEAEGNRALDIMNRGSYDPRTRAEDWRKDGWTGRTDPTIPL